MFSDLVKCVWNDRDIWASMSRNKKKKITLIKNSVLGLSIIGSMLGTLAAIFAVKNIGFYFFNANSIAIASSICLFCAGVFSKELLKPEDELVWVKCRLIAESIKREVWYYLMNIPPYDIRCSDKNETIRLKDEILIEKTQNTFDQISQNEIIIDEEISNVVRTKILNKKNNENNENLDVGTRRNNGRGATSSHDTELISELDLNSYIKYRLEDQVEFYKKSIKNLNTKRTKWKIISISISIFAGVIGLLGTTYNILLLIVPLITTITSATILYLQMKRIDSLIPIYQNTLTKLAYNLTRNMDISKIDPIAFVKSCEDIMANENNLWKIEFLNREEVKNRIDSLNVLIDSANANLNPKVNSKSESKTHEKKVI